MSFVFTYLYLNCTVWYLCLLVPCASADADGSMKHHDSCHYCEPLIQLLHVALYKCILIDRLIIGVQQEQTQVTLNSVP